MLDSLLRLNALYDFYGDLLTENQNKSFVYYYRYDYSLSEISDLIGISRQGVSDNLKRARNELESFEDKLGLYEKSLKVRQYINEIDQVKDHLKSKNTNKEFNEIMTLVEKLIEELNK